MFLGAVVALLRSQLAAARAARNVRAQSDRDDLRRLAAALVREFDLLRGADGARVRADYSLANAESAWRGAPVDTNGTQAANVLAMRELVAKTTAEHAAANDRARGLVGELRISHPALADEAKTFWRTSLLGQHSDQQAAIRASLDYAPLEAAEDRFVAAAQQVFDEYLSAASRWVPIRSHRLTSDRVAALTRSNHNQRATANR